LIAALYGWHAWRFDHYHRHAERIYRVTTTVTQADDRMRSAQAFRAARLAPATTLRNE